MNNKDTELIWENYAQVVRDEEMFNDVAFKYNGMDEKMLKFHEFVIGELLEMDEMSRAEATGDGPQHDRYPQ